MNKADIDERLTGRMGMNRSMAKDAVDGVLEATGAALAKGESADRWIPNLRHQEASGRTGRNRRTGEVVEIKASTTPVFKPSKALGQAVNGISVL